MKTLLVFTGCETRENVSGCEEEGRPNYTAESVAGFLACCS